MCKIAVWLIHLHRGKEWMIAAPNWTRTAQLLAADTEQWGLTAPADLDGMMAYGWMAATLFLPF